MGGVLSHRVKVMGRELQVRSPASPQKVFEIEQFVNARLAEVPSSASGGDTLAVVSLALLNLAGDFLALAEEHDRLGQEYHDRLIRLLNRLDGGNP